MGNPVSVSVTTMSDDPATLVDEAGMYWIQGLTPGTYTVDIVADGQSVASHEDVEVRAWVPRRAHQPTRVWGALRAQPGHAHDLAHAPPRSHNPYRAESLVGHADVATRHQ